MKKTILVPTDFSSNALTATRYALEIAKKIGANIHILHAYRPFTSAFQSPLANEADVQRATMGAKKGLTEFMENVEDDPHVSITSSIEKNGILEAITSFIEENNVCLVVMGTHGASGWRKDLLGSNNYDVAKDVSRPLLIVPEHTASFKLKNVVFFSDYKQGDAKSLGSFDKLFRDMNPSYTLVHIHEDKKAPQEGEQQKLAEWKAILEKENPMANLSTELAHVPENVDAVNEILKRLNADMTLITLVDARNFFEKLLHKSLARAIILNPQTPVLLTSEDTE